MRTCRQVDETKDPGSQRAPDAIEVPDVEDAVGVPGPEPGRPVLLLVHAHVAPAAGGPHQETLGGLCKTKIVL